MGLLDLYDVARVGRVACMTVPEDHPRRESLLTRKKIEEGIDKGITSRQGLIAEGRGEAFDYLLGERTLESAYRAERAAVAEMLLAEHPVISVNGNVAALCPKEAVELADAVSADLEVNIFHRTRERLEAIADHLKINGADEAGVVVRGLKADAEIPGLSSERARVDSEGIYSADVVLIPLEDGDRCEALVAMNKTEIVVDLNPLSRSPKMAQIPVIDNITRAFPNMTEIAWGLSDAGDNELQQIVDGFDKEEALKDAEKKIRQGI